MVVFVTNWNSSEYMMQVYLHCILYDLLNILLYFSFYSNIRCGRLKKQELK